MTGHAAVRSVDLVIVTARLADVVPQALAQASVLLQEHPEDLVVSRVGHAGPHELSRFQQHLGVPARVIKWSVSTTVRLADHVAEERDRMAQRSGPSDGRTGLYAVRDDEHPVS